jgi:hypothetical protein
MHRSLFERQPPDLRLTPHHLVVLGFVQSVTMSDGTVLPVYPFSPAQPMPAVTRAADKYLVSCVKNRTPSACYALIFLNLIGCTIELRYRPILLSSSVHVVATRHVALCCSARKSDWSECPESLIIDQHERTFSPNP